MTAPVEGCRICAVVAGECERPVLHLDGGLVAFLEEQRFPPLRLIVAPVEHRPQAELWTRLAPVARLAAELGLRHSPDGYRILSNFGPDAADDYGDEHGCVQVLGGTFLGEYA